MRRRVMGALCALAFLYCVTCGLFAARYMHKAWEKSTSCTIDPRAAKELSVLGELYPDAGWTAYAESAPETLTNDALPSRTADAAVLRFLGAPERIAFFPFVSGRLPLSSESGVCALDMDTAFKLFGSTDPDGELVRLAGGTARVVGVVDVDRPLALLPAMGQDTVDRLAADDRDILQMLALALGAELDPFEMSGVEATKLAWWLCAVPWVLLIAIGLGALRGLGGAWRPVSSALLIVLLLGALLALLWYAPVRLLPARWSDFAFYSEQIDLWKARAFRAPDVRDRGITSDALRVCLFCMCACVALFVGRKCLGCEKSR